MKTRHVRPRGLIPHGHVHHTGSFPRRLLNSQATCDPWTRPSETAIVFCVFSELGHVTRKSH